MATAITVANFEAALGECYDAIAAADYPSAWKFYAMAEAQHVGLALKAGDRGKTMDRRNALDGLAKAIQGAQTAVNASDRGGGFTTSRLSRGR